MNAKVHAMELKTYFATGRGLASDLAETLGVSRPYLSQMASGISPISPERAVEIEKATKGAVTCEELRPDVDWAYLRGTSKSQQQEPAHV